MDNIITYYQKKGVTFWPRQQLILKLLYGLELTLSELADMRVLLMNTRQVAHRQEARHARLWLASREGVPLHEAAPLINNDDLRLLLQTLQPKMLVLTTGRRAGTSFLIAAIQRYEYELLRTDPDYRATHNLYQNQTVHVITCAPTAHLAAWSGANAAQLGREDLTVQEPSADFEEPYNRFTLTYPEHQAVRGLVHTSVAFEDPCLYGWNQDWRMQDILYSRPTRARCIYAGNPTAFYTVQGSLHERTARTGEPGVLVVQLASWEMNPTIRHHDETIWDAYRRNPIEADREFGAQWEDEILALARTGFYRSSALELGVKGLRYAQTHG